ncbi:MAG TPA: GDCCVxC domain-containing (seleno)protein [Anaerolineales bacterium]
MLASRLTCPACGAMDDKTMPIDSCLFFYTCPACGAALRPAPGDCCVFCSFGSMPCPSKQLETGVQ